MSFMDSDDPTNLPENSLSPDSDLYGLLHVPREARDEDLRRSYRQLASVYHPDKYQSPQMQAVATENFQRIRAAYDILINPQQRQVYDIYGTDGLSSGLELGPCLKTPQEIRDEFERVQMRRQELKKQARTNQIASMLMSVSMAETLKSFDRLPRVMGMNLSSQVQAGLSERDLVVLGGNMVARQGAGGGTAHATWRRALSTRGDMLEVTAVTGLRSLLSVSCTRAVSDHSSASMGLSLNLSAAELALTNSWTRQLSPSSTAAIHLGLGAEPGVGLSWQHGIHKGSVSGDVKVGSGGAMVSGSVSRMLWEKAQGRATLRLGTQVGVDVEVGGSVRVSEHSSVGMFCSLGLLQGVMWKIRYTRGGHKFVIPVILAPTLRPGVALGALLLPSALTLLLQVWLLKPYRERRKRRKELQQRRQNAVQVTEAMSAALRAQELLRIPVVRKLRLQEEKCGLVITSALYGNLAMADSAREAEGEQEEEGLPLPFLDVTVPLQFFVEETSLGETVLLLHAGISKKGLMGFCDPCPGEEKSLCIEYTYHGHAYKVVVSDMAELKIPQHSHRIAGQSESDLHSVD